ncbi:tRNA (guanine(10)-N(2))-dimethyltransferase [Methanococcoides sp. FTZ1]|uniref:tRNA (guanine(10)-N(2))-dimethyltransferase n=1 Tax=Methanococcoides sp. FTZ1 TaxID=3439061 RepID=UPI003F85F3E3
MKSTKVTEGTTTVLVPVPPEGVSFPPSEAPVFYNTHMELNRDISVAATLAYARRLSSQKDIAISDISYVDTMSASGIRGLRIANEVGVSVTLNDWSDEAFELILENIQLTGLSETTEATCKNANVLMHERRFNIVDLDPFGSPAPYLDAATRSVVHLLEVTATDTAPLCGAHLNSGMRKYAAVPLNNEFHSEMGVRILLGKVARELAKHDKGMMPLLSHATRHYVRSYLQVKKGAKQADSTLRELGFLTHCEKCGQRRFFNGLAAVIDDKCPSCESSMQVAGPLWLGKLHEGKFCDEVLSEMGSLELGKKDQAEKIIVACRDELDTPFFYDQHVMCKMIGVSAPPMDTFIEALRGTGASVSRTHFSGTSFKTDAVLETINDVLRSL